MENGKLRLQGGQQNGTIAVTQGIRFAVRRRGQCGDGVVNGSRGNVFARGGFEKNDIAFLVACADQWPIWGTTGENGSIPKAMFPFLIHAATSNGSKDANLDTC